MPKKQRIYPLVIALIAVLLLLAADVVFIYKELSKSIKIYIVPLYNQKDTNWCWAYCQLMIEDGKSLRIRSEKSADQRAADIVKESYGELPTDEMGSPITARDLRINTMRELYDALCEYGPLYAEYDRFSDAEKREGHSIVITGVDLINDVVYTNNPWGRRGRQSFEEFKSDLAGAEDGEWVFMGYYYIE